MRRTELPARLTGTTGTDLVRWEDLFDLLDLHPELCAPIAASTLLTKKEGRPRRPGEWGWAYLAYVSSGHRELRRWHRQTSDALWDRAGFAATPSYWSAYETFAALEAHAAAFEQSPPRSSRSPARRAAARSASTSMWTAPRLRPTRGSCTTALATSWPTASVSSSSRGARKRLTPASIGTAPRPMSRARSSCSARRPRSPPTNAASASQSAGAGIGSATTRRASARTRAVTRSRASGRATTTLRRSTTTRAACSRSMCARRAPRSTRRTRRCTSSSSRTFGGETPRAIVADRGFSVSEVFELHTRNGIASIIPWRKSISEPTRVDHERFDRHGVPYCAHCGMETVFHRFVASNGASGEPRLWYRCARPSGPGCQRVQSMLCKEGWRSLLPLWRTTAAYQALRASHQNYEQTHHRWRERYAVAGDTRADRPKRIGLGVQQLRASAALVIEWLTICHRQGWLGGPVLNTQVERVICKRDADQLVQNIAQLRHRIGLSGVDPAHREEHVAQVAVFDENHLDARRRGRATLLRRQRNEVEEAEQAVVGLQDLPPSDDGELDAL